MRVEQINLYQKYNASKTFANKSQTNITNPISFGMNLKVKKSLLTNIKGVFDKFIPNRDNFIKNVEDNLKPSDKLQSSVSKAVEIEKIGCEILNSIQQKAVETYRKDVSLTDLSKIVESANKSFNLLKDDVFECRQLFKKYDEIDFSNLIGEKTIIEKSKGFSNLYEMDKSGKISTSSGLSQDKDYVYVVSQKNNEGNLLLQFVSGNNKLLHEIRIYDPETGAITKTIDRMHVKYYNKEGNLSKEAYDFIERLSFLNEYDPKTGNKFRSMSFLNNRLEYINIQDITTQKYSKYIACRKDNSVYYTREYDSKGHAVKGIYYRADGKTPLAEIDSEFIKYFKEDGKTVARKELSTINNKNNFKIRGLYN